jgi:hypothetical protein
MLRETAGRFTVFVLVLTLLSALATVTRAESGSIDYDAAVRKVTAGNAGRVLSAGAKQIPRSRPCNLKKRVLAGAVIGAVAGMVVVKRAAAAHDGTVGPKDTLGGGAYGAALGSFLGLNTCR